MKKLILVFLVTLALGSCVKEKNENSVTISRDEYDGLTSQEKEYPKPFSKTNLPNGTNGDDLIVLGSDGHEYILITANGIEGFTHSPECIKCKAKEDELKSLLYQMLNKKKDTLK